MSWDQGDSNCWSVGETRRVANMSPGKSSTGSRFTVAAAAPVTIFVAPGPMEDVQANVASRFFILA